MSWHKIGMFKAVIHYMRDTNSIEVFHSEIFSFEHVTDGGGIEDIIKEEIDSDGVLKVVSDFVDITINPQTMKQSSSDIFKSIAVPVEPKVKIEPNQTEFYVDVYGELWGFSVVYPASPNGPEEYDYKVDFRDCHCKFLEKDLAEKYINLHQELEPK
jgi:hypothetical protein